MFFWKKFPQCDALLYSLAYTFHFLTFLHITFIYIFIITHIKFNNDKLSFFFLTFQKLKDCPKSKRVSHIFNFLQHSLIYTPVHLNMYTVEVNSERKNSRKYNRHSDFQTGKIDRTVIKWRKFIPFPLEFANLFPRRHDKFKIVSELNELINFVAHENKVNLFSIDINHLYKA
jgi:hypothetical protein